MKLLHCNIINYGCLHDFSWNFTEGINVINQPNGWGKSTLVSFLCAMLYGLNSSSRKNIQDNDRKHYEPWQGGVFGGSLSFEVSGRTSDKLSRISDGISGEDSDKVPGKQYLIERTFGRKEKEDTFVLYDLKTMQPSKDFSSQPGRDLLGIDRDGFIRSICIPQARLSSGYNDSLAARLSRITQTSGDIEQYEKASASIDKVLHYFVKTGNRGEIALLSREADNIEHQIAETAASLGRLEQLSGQLTRLEQQEKQYRNQLTQIRCQLQEQTRREVLSHYHMLNRHLAEKEQELSQLESFFQNLLPEEADLESSLLQCRELSRMELKRQLHAPDSGQLEDYDFLQILFADRDSANSDSADSDSTGSDSVHLNSADSDSSHSNSADSDSAHSDSAGSDSAHSDSAGSDSAHLNSADSDSVFTASQKQLLLHSEKYHAQAELLFSEEELCNDACFSPEDLPDPEEIDRARQLYYKYRSLLEVQTELSESILKLTDQIQVLQNSLNSEKQMIHDCQIQLDHLHMTQDHKPVPDSPQEQMESASDFLFLSVLAVTISVFIFAGILSGFLFSPVVGILVFLTGILILCMIMLFRYPEECKHLFRTLSGKDPADPADDGAEQDFVRQSARLEMEIQLRGDTCNQLDRQISQLQNQLTEKQTDSDTNKSMIEEHLRQLQNAAAFLQLSDQINSTDFLISLTKLQEQMEKIQETQQQRYNNYRRQKSFYQDLFRRKEEYDLQSASDKRLEQEIADIRQVLSQYLSPYFSISGKETASELDHMLHQLQLQLTTYRDLLSDMLSASQSRQKFLKEHPDFNPMEEELSDPALEERENFSSDSDTVELIPVSALQEEEASLQEQYQETIQQISSLRSQIGHLQNLPDEYRDLTEKKDRLQLKIRNYTERYHILSLTRQYLEQARHDFSASYLRSVEKNLSHYLHFFDRKELESLHLTTDFHMVVSGNGILRESSWYSQGTRDLMDFCLRLSIIEDLFSEESPFLILDDPFVNLDDDTFHRLSSLLKEISGKWQILYFTCHTSSF